jgi:cyanophycin synthetase
MIDLASLPVKSLSQTQKSMQQQVIARGWKAEVPYIGSPHYFLTRDDGTQLHTFSTTSPFMSYPAASLANDKFAVHQLLQGTEVPLLDTIRIEPHDATRDAAVEFLRHKGKVVVKPIDGAHGRGVTVDVVDEIGLHEAIDRAFESAINNSAVLVQEQFKADVICDLRVLCIDFEYVAALQRIPARVFGDGVHTVAELIDIENSSERRGKPYYAELATIERELALKYLGSQAHEVVEVDQEVYVLGVANYGAGGETVDVTEQLPHWLVAVAKTVAKKCELEVAGVDFMLNEPPRVDSLETDLRVAMTEVNKAPLLTMHDNPTYGESREVFQKYMDYLASI